MDPISQNVKILIVDDEPALLKMMGRYLTRMGYAVTALETTEKAWAAAEEAPGQYAAAVLDATLRGLSTSDLALRLLQANPSICVIIASGYPVDTSALEAAGPARVHFVQKPFTAETLAGTLRRLIGPQEKGL
jgi:two-component system cell cycle sensor histidine kinase/response regulator CckA